MNDLTPKKTFWLAFAVSWGMFFGWATQSAVSAVLAKIIFVTAVLGSRI